MSNKRIVTFCDKVEVKYFESETTKHRKVKNISPFKLWVNTHPNIVKEIKDNAIIDRNIKNSLIIHEIKKCAVRDYWDENINQEPSLFMKLLKEMKESYE